MSAAFIFYNYKIYHWPTAEVNSPTIRLQNVQCKAKGNTFELFRLLATLSGDRTLLIALHPLRMQYDFPEEKSLSNSYHTDAEDAFQFLNHWALAISSILLAASLLMAI